MTSAVVLAFAAGCVGAFALVDLAALWSVARPPRWRRGRHPGGRRPAGGGATGRALRGLLLSIGRRLGAPAPSDLAARIEAAGVRTTVADVMALKCGAAVAGALLALAAGPLAPGRLGLAVLVAAPAAGFLAPDLLLRRRARGRQAQMALELADVVELLRVAVSAGLTPGRALDEVGRRHAGLLAHELRAVGAMTGLGAPQRQALEALRRRAPLEGVVTLTTALDRAASHGAPLQPALGSLAEQARADRARAVQDRAARAAPKIQLVVALLLVPAVLLLVAAALAASFG